MEQYKQYNRSSDQLIDRYITFLDIMNSDNPLTRDEIKLLIAKRPEKYGFMKTWLTP